MKKKMLSMLMALAMILSLLPVTALAADGTACAGGEDCTHVAAIGDVLGAAHMGRPPPPLARAAVKLHVINEIRFSHSYNKSLALPMQGRQGSDGFTFYNLEMTAAISLKMSSSAPTPLMWLYNPSDL